MTLFYSSVPLTVTRCGLGRILSGLLLFLGSVDLERHPGFLRVCVSAEGGSRRPCPNV